MFDSISSAIYSRLSSYMVAASFAGEGFLQPSLQIFHDYHLDTAQGRAAFLARVTHYTAHIKALHNEIQALAQKIQNLSPQTQQEEIVLYSKEVAAKKEIFFPMLKELKDMLLINEDFLQIDTILNQEFPLSEEQQQIVNRVRSVCHAIEEFEKMQNH